MDIRMLQDRKAARFGHGPEDQVLAVVAHANETDFQAGIGREQPEGLMGPDPVPEIPDG
jgi:hypothetical protein